MGALRKVLDRVQITSDNQNSPPRPILIQPPRAISKFVRRHNPDFHAPAIGDVEEFVLQKLDLKPPKSKQSLINIRQLMSETDTAGDRLWQIVHPHEVDEVEVSPEKAEELKAKWGTERDQLWQIGSHRIICGDCNDGAVVARLWPKSEN
jgi:hypothetical protein